MAVGRFIPEIVEQHSENAAGLWLIRDSAVNGPSITLTDLVKLDERVEANIDGLRIAETTGWSVPLDHLNDADASSYFVAGSLAVESDDFDRFDRVIGFADADAAAATSESYHPAYDPWRGLVSALSWVETAPAEGMIERLLESARPRKRWLGAAACGARRAAEHKGLDAALADDEPLVRARMARTIGELGRSVLRPALISLSMDRDENCRFWAAWSATLLGMTEGPQTLYEFAQTPGLWSEVALDLLLRALPVRDANELLRPLGRDMQRRRNIIRATAAIGDPTYVPWLINQLEQPAVTQHAAEAVIGITGVNVDAVRRDESPEVQSVPNDDPNDQTVVSPENNGIPSLDPTKCRQWWQVACAHFRSEVGYFQGQPKASVNWLSVLANARQALRRTAAIELALQRPGRPLFAVRARGNHQRQLLGRASDLF
jgi:uncharacterized protein (TIGR02270 family)